MFDQIEGLRWTQKFIKYFGGDPTKVTIMGESAGAASVGFLLLAPQARGRKKKIPIEFQDHYILHFATGLFRGAIAESGSILTDWAIDRDQITSGRKISEYAGCPLEPYHELVDCLRNVDVKTLMDAQGRYSVNILQNDKIVTLNIVILLGVR